MNKYTKEICLSSGYFGTIWRVKSNLNNMTYVLKELDLDNKAQIDRQRIFTEVSLISKLHHPHIIKYKETLVDKSFLKFAIVMEFAEGGDMHTAILKRNSIPFPESCVLSWFTQICLALQYIHCRNILHRDLKTPNLFLTKSGLVKIGDFGISKVLRNADDLATTLIGTPYYLSPEICARKPYNSKSDMWALGCILFELSTLELPFKHEDIATLVALIMNGTRKPFPRSSIKEIVDKLLSVNPDERPSVEEVLQHPSLQSYISNCCHECGSFKRKPDFIEILNSFGVESHNKSPVFYTPRRNTLFSPKITKGDLSLPQDISGRTRSLSIQATYSKPSFIPKPKESNKPRGVFSNLHLMSKSPKKSTTDMNATYIVSETSVLNSGFLADPRKNETYTLNDIDYGYQSEYAYSSYCIDGKPNSLNCNNITKSVEEKLYKNTQISDNYQAFNRISFHDDGKYSSRESISSNCRCQHNQCYQCMLNILWKNRIRSSVDSKSYSNLKTKLLSVFKEHFEMVHQYLVYDWEGHEVGEGRASIKGLMEVLNYAQIQNLPLMMQLIQIEFQTKH